MQSHHRIDTYESPHNRYNKKREVGDRRRRIGTKMLGRTQKKVKHGKKREVGDRRRRIERGEMEKVSTWMACDRVSY